MQNLIQSQAKAKDRRDVCNWDWVNCISAILVSYLLVCPCVDGGTAVLGHQSEVSMTMLIITQVTRGSSGRHGEPM